MDNNKKNIGSNRARTDRGTYDKEKNSERNRWKQNLKNYMTSDTEDNTGDFEEFEEFE
jgi:hypothetical protein